MGFLGRRLNRKSPKDELTFTREQFGYSLFGRHEVLTFSKHGQDRRMRVHAMIGSLTAESTYGSRFAVDVVNASGETNRSIDVSIDAQEPRSDDHMIEIATQAAKLAFTLLGEER